MFRYKKISIVSLTIVYVILTLIELVLFLNTNSNLYGVIYLLLSLLIIFLMVPLAYNYKRHYSKARISKLITIIVIGVFSSFFLQMIYLSNIPYMDSSNNMIDKLFVIKNVLKPIVYFLLLVFTIIESNIISKIKTRFN